ncbi:Uncharacterised protein [Chlamydia trachomatis]|nr:Uncharacterised protein [Chlamydia trachomatis]
MAQESTVSEEPTIHIVEEEGDLMNQPGVLPFDEEDLKPQVEPVTKEKPRREKPAKPKKEKSKGGSLLGRLIGLKDLFVMADDDSNFSDDEE